MDERSRSMGGYPPGRPGLGMGGQGGKPGQPPGISAAEVQALKAKVDQLEKQLLDLLHEKNNWNAVLRDWQDNKAVIMITLLNEDEVKGTIEWVDRYTIGLMAGTNGPTIVHKGAIAKIQKF